MNVINGKCAFRKRSRLIENNRISLGYCLKGIGTLNEYSLPRSAAYSAEKRQRNRYDQSAGAGYYQEYKCSSDPGAPDFTVRDTQEEGRNDSQKKSCNDYDRGIPVSKPFNEVLCLSLVFGRIFNEFQDLGNSTLGINAARSYLAKTRKV